MNKPIDFEDALKKLETIVSKLESGNVKLSESINLYKEGLKLSKYCSKVLNDAKQSIEVIKNENYEDNEFDTESEGQNEL